MDTGSEPKRRKVRKGTHTCWECKRRKVRCVMANPDDTVCVGCAKRCLPCVSQEFPEERTTAAAKSRLVGERIVRVEAMIQQLVHQSGQSQTGSPASLTPQRPPLRPSREHSPMTTPAPIAAVCSMPTPAASDTCMATVLSGPSPSTVAGASLDRLESHTDLSAALLAVYPPQHDLDLIASCADAGYNHYQMIMRSQKDIEANGFWRPTELRTRHPPQTHPVVLARQMLLIAMALQGSDPYAQKELDGGQLSEPVQCIVARLGDTAVRLVTSDDALLNTLGGLDGLECVMLEAIYHGNAGRLRRAWLTWRRALSLAQLLCIPRRLRQTPAAAPASRLVETDVTSVPGTRSHSLNPQFLWYRILSAEWVLCLLLGLPQAALVALPVSSEALHNDTPMGQLEHKMMMVTSYILDRNERGPRAEDHATTEQIDGEMQRIAAALPSRWWLAPNMAAVPPGDHEQSAWEMVRLTCQVIYYNILNQLHLPYMLHPSVACSPAAPADVRRRLEYSRIAAVGASREVLSRYVAFRGFNSSACCCRLLEFIALTASLTLILVHIDGHRHTAQNGPASNVLAHQRLPDRAMMEEALDRMALVASRNDADTISETSVDLLRQLLDIEADTACGSRCALEGGESNANGATSSSSSSSSSRGTTTAAGSLRIDVPFVGLITIARDGAITKEVHASHEGWASRTASGGDAAAASCLVPSVSAPSMSSAASSTPLASLAPRPQPQPQPQLNNMLAEDGNQASFSTCLATTDAIPSSSAPQPSGLLFSGAGDPWAFQGVDMAFFDSLMRETNSLEPAPIAAATGTNGGRADSLQEWLLPDPPHAPHRSPVPASQTASHRQPPFVWAEKQVPSNADGT